MTDWNPHRQERAQKSEAAEAKQQGSRQPASERQDPVPHRQDHIVIHSTVSKQFVCVLDTLFRLPTATGETIEKPARSRVVSERGQAGRRSSGLGDRTVAQHLLVPRQFDRSWPYTVPRQRTQQYPNDATGILHPSAGLSITRQARLTVDCRHRAVGCVSVRPKSSQASSHTCSVLHSTSRRVANRAWR